MTPGADGDTASAMGDDGGLRGSSLHSGSYYLWPLNGRVPECPVYELPPGKRQQPGVGGHCGHSKGGFSATPPSTKCLALPGDCSSPRAVDTGCRRRGTRWAAGALHFLTPTPKALAG